jgi:phosphorylcholine metabolism protein LicD
MINENLMKDFKLILTVAEELKLRLFLEGGTLLSAIREKTFIAHDHDFDFGLLRSEFPPEMKDIFIKALTSKKLTFKGFEAPCFAERPEYARREHMMKFWSKYAHWNTDFWIFEKTDKEYYHKGWGGYFHFPLECLDTLDEIEFLGMKILVPHNPELYLETLYGKTWKIPLPGFKKNGIKKDYGNWTKEL